MKYILERGIFSTPKYFVSAWKSHHALANEGEKSFIIELNEQTNITCTMTYTRGMHEMSFP